MPRTVLAIAVAVVAVGCLSLSVAADPELDKHLESGAILLILGAIGGLIAWRNARSKAGEPARPWLEDIKEAGRQFGPLAIAAVLASVVGVLLHPLVQATDNVPSLVLLALGTYLGLVAAAIEDDDARPIVRVLRPALILVVICGVVGALWLFVQVLAWGREWGFVAIALVVIAMLVMEVRDRHRAEARESADTAARSAVGEPGGR